VSYAGIALLAALLLPAAGFAQTAERLGAVKKLFVGSFGDKPGASVLRENLAARLSKSHGVTVVMSAANADAVVTGSGEVWIKGHFSLNPRQREINSDSQPIYGGYLSVEVKGKGGETLWSYLVTPQRGFIGDVNKDLAGHVVKKMLEAMAEEKKSP
jgi:hypothetical protein